MLLLISVKSISWSVLGAVSYRENNIRHHGAILRPCYKMFPRRELTQAKRSLCCKNSIIFGAITDLLSVKISASYRTNLLRFTADTLASLLKTRSMPFICFLLRFLEASALCIRYIQHFFLSLNCKYIEYVFLGTTKQSSLLIFTTVSRLYTKVPDKESA